MDRLLFGISGLPLGEGGDKFNYSTGIEYLHSIGLNAKELPFVRSINVTAKNKDAIINMKEKYKFHLTAHGSYFINLNAEEQEKIDKSIERIIGGAEALYSVGGNNIVFHSGYYLKNTPEETFIKIEESLKRLPEKYEFNYRLETTGKPTQFGSIDELIRICKNIPSCKLCIDFSHIHARYNGILKNYEDFAAILYKVGENLGKEALEDLHIHLSGIHYGEKGEKNHLPFLESDFNYKACLKAFIDFNVKGCVICESPILEKDALLLKNCYESL
ncbi:TIM barrel protein [Desnuesiella massiliensis]|uniref:TIM barrel protein n=1 Tax=Desnuesiella massiliensis TaxID=1650662 RepID=UPI0006E2AF4B|nr:TIM barrel protein [Desnuesiella massiliensis]